MACFLVPAVEAVAVTFVTKAVEKKEMSAPKIEKDIDCPKVSLSRKLHWLTYMLWGGIVLLAFEHVWHGEVVPWFPFLTAMADPADAAEMFHEMATVGVSMAIIVTVVWVCMCKAADVIVSRSEKAVASNNAA